jgi:hypothetical protein
MKKVMLFVLSLMFIVSVGFAGNLSVNSVSNVNTQCDLSQSADIDYYIAGSNITRNPYDIFGNTLDSLISKTSEVDVWYNDGVLTNCVDWNRVSNVTVANDSN